MEKRTYPALHETVYWDRLPNGLTIAVVPRPGFSKKLCYFAADYGSIHREFTLDGVEMTAPEGVAHYLEHKLFDMPQGDVTQAFTALGASPNAFTSFDMTAYYFSCTDHFPQCLRLLLEFVSTPYFTQASVEKERGIIGQEIDMHLDNPDSRSFELLAQAMYENHPVRQAILGTRASIAQITPEILTACHRAFYRPGNMLLCAVGDVDPEQIRDLALEILPQGPGAEVTGVRSWKESMVCPQPCVRDTMDVAMPTFQLGFKCEPLGRGREAVLQEIIGDLAAEALFGESSPLYLELYRQGLIDNSFGGGLDTIEGMTMLTAYGDSEDPLAVRDAILDYAQKLLREGLSPEDLLRMKRSVLGRRIRDLDSFNTVCTRLCSYYFSGFDYFQFPALYQDITWEDLRALIARVVTRERCAISIIDPICEEEL